MIDEIKSRLFALMSNLLFSMAKVDSSPRGCDEMVDYGTRSRAKGRDRHGEVDKWRMSMDVGLYPRGYALVSACHVE
jgi:hypothetical protein